MEKKIFIHSRPQNHTLGVLICSGRSVSTLRLRSVLILLGLAMLLVSSGIYADEDRYGAVKAIELEPITVTASRIERRLSEVPSSVSIVTEKEIKASSAKSIPDLLKDLEGVYTYDSSGVGTAGRINMRGFWGGMSTHQLILIDGIPQNKGKDKLVDWNLIPLDNIERIEVVRGSASSLYGDTAFAGVINIITKEGGKTPETDISSSFGDFNTQNYRISTCGTAANVNYLFNVSRGSTDGFREHSDYEDIHLTGKLGFYIGDTSNVKISMGYHENERGCLAWPLSEAELDADRNQAQPGTEDDEGEATKADLGLTFSKDIGDISTLLSTFYVRQENSHFYSSGGSTGSTTTKEYLEDGITYGSILRYNVTPRLFGKDNAFVMGVDLGRDEFDYENYDAPGHIRGTLRDDYNAKKDTMGFYIQDEIEIAKPWSLILGLRHDEAEYDFINYKNNVSKKRSMYATSPKLGVIYAYRENCSLYANVAKAFRTPTIGQLFAYSSANIDLNPEEAANYEVGIRHRFNDYLKTNVSLYWMELDNEIGYDYATRKYNNYGKTSHRGIETSLDFKIIKGLSGFANYTYTRAKNENGAYAGEYLANIPIHKWGLGLQAQTKFGLKANLNINNIGSTYIDSENNNKLSGYATVDAKVSYEYKGWLTFLAVDNLFNETYNSYGCTSGGTRYFNPAPGRTFTFGAEVNF